MPPFDVKECQQRGLTYASPLRARVRLTIMDKEASKPTVKEGISKADADAALKQLIEAGASAELK